MNRFFAVYPLALLTGMLLLALSCSGGGGSSATPYIPPTSPDNAAKSFFSLWQKKDYNAMYDLVSSSVRQNLPREKFVQRYEAMAGEATITGVDFELGSKVGDGQIAVKVTLHTSFFGDIKQDNVISLVEETVTEESGAPGVSPRTHEEWRVEWRPSLVFKELDDASLVHFFVKVPKRGTIFDVKGRPLALDAPVAVVGAVPDRIEDTELLIDRLAPALGVPAGEIREKLDAKVPSYYFIPIRTLPYTVSDAEIQKFYDMAGLGVLVQKKTMRAYPNGSLAANVLGYMSELTAEQLVELAPRGYREGDKIGAFGLEHQFDKELAGERGGALVTVTPEGARAETIAERPEKPGKDIVLTIDIDVQRTAEEALGERPGSVVSIDPRDNSVLALASFPRFDPNAFIRGLTTQEAESLQNDPRRPFLNKPLLATYPPGSTFKVVTAAAGLEEGGFSPASRIPCPPVWDGLGPAFVKRNWETRDRGALTVAEGLMSSCDPVFYELALALDNKDPNILPRYSEAFGFGKITGINGLEEASGINPDSKWKEETQGEPWYSGDSVNMGIGQGFLQVPPIQIANAYSAIAGDGILRKPLLVKRIEEPGGAGATEFSAEEIHKLPVSASTLAAIREGLGLVVHSPGGTSFNLFQGSKVDAAGKTGTAEDIAFGSDRVFFVGYANRSAPSIVTLASLESGTSGSGDAGPIVKKVLEARLAPSS